MVKVFPIITAKDAATLTKRTAITAVLVMAVRVVPES